jgi:hypothetical protein
LPPIYSARGHLLPLFRAILIPTGEQTPPGLLLFENRYSLSPIYQDNLQRDLIAFHGNTPHHLSPKSKNFLDGCQKIVSIPKVFRVSVNAWGRFFKKAPWLPEAKKLTITYCIDKMQP